MPLARLHAPFDHPDWIFEPKLDGFRAVAYVDNGAARLVSRKQNVYKSFPVLTAAIGNSLSVRDAILDGEIVHLGPGGAAQFYDLMRRRPPQHFYGFDILWLDGRDLRELPLVERKRLLRKMIPTQPSPVLYVNHVVGTGAALYDAVCAKDLGRRCGEAAIGSYAAEANNRVHLST
jgi:bifunctional non-homologous end joining protein LigD